MKNKEQKSSKPDGYLSAAFATPVELTARQENYARQAVGAARFIYNWCAATHKFCRINRLALDLGHDKPGWPTAVDIHKEINAIKNADIPWIRQLSKFVVHGAVADFDKGIRKRSADRKKAQAAGTKCKTGFPRFKKKRATGTGAFLAASGIANIKYDGHKRLKLPFLGSVKLARALPKGFIPVTVRVKRANMRWSISVAGYLPPKPQTARQSQTAVGVDVGIDPLAASVSDDGAITLFDNPQAFYREQKRKRRWQRALARRTPGSKGWWEAQRKIAKCDRRIKGIRRNAQHQLSKTIASSHWLIGIETLLVAGMDKLRWQAKAIRDAAIGELLRQIRYKAQWYGAIIHAASRWYPSSKTCSSCLFINKELKREKWWTCPNCGVKHERNINAARNLLRIALDAVRIQETPGDGPALAAGNPPAEQPARKRGPRRKNPEPERNRSYGTQLRLAP